MHEGYARYCYLVRFRDLPRPLALLEYSWSPYGEGCGAEGDDATWYWEFTHCYRANVGFSLYGTLAGKRNRSCNKGSYINSFFTTGGVQAFTQVLEAAGVSFTAADDDSSEYAAGVSAECTTDASDDDASRSRSHMQKSHSDAKSYGTGCNSKRFVLQTFQGAYCDSSDVIRTTDKLRTFNQEIANVDCVQIYDSEDGYDDDDDEGPIAFLQNSEACSIRAYPGACPDPYGKLEKYTRSLERATGTTSGSFIASAARSLFAWAMMFMGLSLYGLGIYAIRWREKRRRKASGRRQKQSRNVAVPRLGKMFRKSRTRSSSGKGNGHEQVDSPRSQKSQSPRSQKSQSP
jgi:hypothetical protein